MKKLKKILLINWLYFSKELIEVGDINFLTGKNGAVLHQHHAAGHRHEHQ